MRRLRWFGAFVVLAVGAAVLIAAVTGDEAEDSNPVGRGNLRTPERVRARPPRRPARKPAARSVRLAARLPVERRVAQVFLVGFDGTEVTAPVFADIGRRGWGGIALEAGNYLSPE